MDELKKWLLNRISVLRRQEEKYWQEQQYAYENVLEKIEQIESDGGFDNWYDTQVSGADVKSIACKKLCRQSWKAAIEHANKTGQE